MPFLGIGFHVIVALFFAVHAVRTHQNMYWLFILFVFPLLGSVAYFFAIYLPELRYSRGARVATRAVSQLIDPNRAVREARNDFDRTPTVQHRLRLGEALLEAGDAKEARQHFEQAATGPFAGDPAVLLGLARAQFATGDAAPAQATLAALFEAHRAARQQPDPTLLYARALAATGAPGTRGAFEQALACANDAAARCLYGEWLLTQNGVADKERARTLFDEILRDARHWTRYAKDHNREWLQRAQAAQSSFR
ncbi:tetratricopeptide repeat protein [Ralstonia solanacearum]|uniref:tetratricopeptide repeat protein n=1 Tax=Ralstonia solanacearum TaxID=305 RepID=UPI0018D03572|nr:tetratricopeptide repeat protein [Ralstonia solanacearum]